MKRNKRLFSALLTLLLLLCLLPCPAQAAGAGFSGDGRVRAGDSVTVTFSVSGSGLQGITAELHYDTGALTLTGTSQLIGDSWSVDMSGGKLLAYDKTLSAPINESTRLLAFTFRVKEGLSAGSTVSATISDIVASDGSSDQSLGSATWSATVAAPLSGNCRLQSLRCEGYDLSPAFDPDTSYYSLSVPYSMTQLPLQYSAAHSGARVSVSGNQLSEGENTVVLTVTAEDGSTRRYTLSVTRQADPNAVPSSDAALTELSPSRGSLSPAFDPEITEYVVYVPYEVHEITLSATARDAKASGVTQPTVTLSTGENPVAVVCTAEDGSTRSYTVYVCRMPLFQGTLPQIIDPDSPSDTPEPEPEPAPEEPAGPFAALWTALLAPVTLPLLQDRWLPLYAIVGGGLLLLLLLALLLGRAAGVRSGRRRALAATPMTLPLLDGDPIPDTAQPPAPESAAPPETEPQPEAAPVPMAPAPEPEAAPESPALPEEEAEKPEESAEPEEPEVTAAPEPEPTAEPEPVPEEPEAQPAEPEAEEPPQPESGTRGQSTLDLLALDELLNEIRNMQP